MMIKKRLIRRARPASVDLIPDERAVTDMQSDPLCQDLFNEKRFRHLYALGTTDVCSHGQFGYQANYGDGVDLPVLFYVELHTFKDLEVKNLYIGVVLAYRLTEDGEPLGKPFIKKYKGADRMVGAEAFNGLIVDKYTVKFNGWLSFDAVKQARAEEIEQRNKGG